MNDQHGFWWDVLEAVSKWIALLLAAGFGWLTRKFTAVEDRMDSMEKDLLERTQLAATNIVRLEAYHVANTQRLDSIDDRTRGIDSKLDRLIENMTSKQRSRS